ncbi:MAG: RNA polymerase sigma factor [Bacteroidaceae bacterium]|nr:RNA polymerase sigma factor [Bacteroidaceae bacterium]
MGYSRLKNILVLANHRQMTDEQLMQKASQGSETAFEELYRRYARRLQGFFFRQLGGDEELSADFTHDVFLRVYEARSRYLGGTNVATWFFTIAYNLCKNTYRHNGHVADYLSTLDSEPVQEEDVEVRMDQEILHQALSHVLQSLPPPLRLLFSLHYEEELTTAQIAKIENLPEGTVKSRLHKTMNIIRKELKQYENDFQ